VVWPHPHPALRATLSQNASLGEGISVALSGVNSYDKLALGVLMIK